MKASKISLRLRASSLATHHTPSHRPFLRAAVRTQVLRFDSVAVREAGRAGPRTVIHDSVDSRFTIQDREVSHTIRVCIHNISRVFSKHTTIVRPLVSVYIYMYYILIRRARIMLFFIKFWSSLSSLANFSIVQLSRDVVMTSSLLIIGGQGYRRFVQPWNRNASQQ